MAAAIVHGLEAVEVDQEEGEVRAVPASARHPLVDHAVAFGTVRDPRQLVGARDAAKRLLHLVRAGDVLEDADQSDRAPGDALDLAGAAHAAAVSPRRDEVALEVEGLARLDRPRDRARHETPAFRRIEGQGLLDGRRHARLEFVDRVDLIGPDEAVVRERAAPGAEKGHPLGLLEQALLAPQRLDGGLGLLHEKADLLGRRSRLDQSLGEMGEVLQHGERGFVEHAGMVVQDAERADRDAARIALARSGEERQAGIKWT